MTTPPKVKTTPFLNLPKEEQEKEIKEAAREASEMQKDLIERNISDTSRVQIEKNTSDGEKTENINLFKTNESHS